MIWRHPHLPPGYPWQSLQSAHPNCWLLKIRVALVAGLNPTSHDTSWRQPCTTCLFCPEGRLPLRSGQKDVKTWYGSSRCFDFNPMLHRLCGSPSIPLSFILANVLPRWNTYCVCDGTGAYTAPTPSIHRLRRGLPGYLILFAPHAFEPQRQLPSSKPPSPLVFLLISTHFTATLGIPPASPVL